MIDEDGNLKPGFSYSLEERLAWYGPFTEDMDSPGSPVFEVHENKESLTPPAPSHNVRLSEFFPIKSTFNCQNFSDFLSLQLILVRPIIDPNMLI